MAGVGRYFTGGRLISEIWKALKQLNPENVRKEADRPVRVAVIAPEDTLGDCARALLGEDPAAYEHAADILLLLATPLDGKGFGLLPKCDIVLRWSEYDQLLPGVADEHVFEFESAASIGAMAAEVVKEPSLRGIILALGRAIPAFRKEIGTHVIQTTSIENAIFVASTALGNVIPNPLQALTSLAEAAGDLVVLTANQIRMLFMLAAVYDRELRLKQHAPEIASIVGAAFGWRSIARELAGKLPLGLGIAPKAGVAFAGTWAVGDAIVFYYVTGSRLSKEDTRQRFEDALRAGRATIEQIAAKVTSAYARRRSSGSEDDQSRTPPA